MDKMIKLSFTIDELFQVMFALDKRIDLKSKELKELDSCDLNFPCLRNTLITDIRISDRAFRKVTAKLGL